MRSKIDFIRMFISSNKPGIFFISESEISQKDLDILKVDGYDLVTF